MSRKVALSLAFSVFGLALFADPATGWLQTGAGPYDYNDAANWVNGEINGVFGEDLALTENQTITFDTDTVVAGLSIAQTGAFGITFKAGETYGAATLTLTGDFVNSGAGAVTFDPSLALDLGSATRTFSTAKALAFQGVIQNGGATIEGAGEVTFSGANTYESGTTLAGTGKVNIENTSAFGTGRLTLCQGCSLNSRVSSFTSTLPITLAGDFTWTTDKKLNPNFGAGELTILRPLTATISSGYTLTLGGLMAEDSPCDFTDVVKAGNGSLSTKAPITVDGEATLTVTSGNWYFGGTINGSGRLVKTGGAYLQIDAESAFAGFSGTFEIAAGSARFMKKYVLNDHIKFLITGSGVLRSNTSKDCGYAYAITSLLPYVDKASTGILGMASNEGGADAVLDLTDYPDLTVAPNGGDFTFTGTIVPPSTGVLKLGGGGKTLTLDGALPSGCDIDASTGSLKITADQSDFNGTVTMGNGFSFVLGGGVSAPGMTVVAGTYTVGDKINGGVVRLGTTATEDAVDSLKKVVLNTAHLTIDAPASGEATLKIGEVSVGVARQGVSKMTVPANVTLRIGDLTRTNGWEMLQVVNSGKVFFETVPTLIGDGPIGTVKTPVIPFVRMDTALATYDETNGLRALAEGEYEEYEGGYEGPITTPGANVVLSGSGTVTLTGSATVNSLTVGNLVLAGAEETQLTIASGAVATISEGSSDLAMPMAFGTRRGYFSCVANKVVKLTGAISGTGGLTLSDMQFGTTSSGMNLGGVGSTYSGDVAVTGYVTISNPSGFFPHGEELSEGVLRLGDFWLFGKLYITNGDCKICSLNGNGTFAPGGSNTSNIFFNNLETDGLFTGTICEKTGLNFGATKDGPRCQRLTGGFVGKWNCTVKGGGTLQIDGICNMGARGTSYHMDVQDGVLSGCGSVSSESTCGSILIKASGVLAPGSAEIPNEPLKLCKNVDLAQGASFRFYVDDTRASQAIISDGYGLTGAATSVPVVVDCQATKAGEWLLLEADSFGGKSFVLDRTVGRSGKRIQVRNVMSADGQTVVREQLWLTVQNGLAIFFR